MTPIEKDHGAGLNGAVAAVLRGERAASGMTLEELADKTNIPVVSVQRYLAAKRPIDMAVLNEFAKALGLTSREIVVAAEARLNRSNGASEAARDED